MREFKIIIILFFVVTFYEESSPEIQLFNQQYFNQNHVYPSYYATKGFDIVFDVGMRLASRKQVKTNI